jgi:hypothetical protein
MEAYATSQGADAGINVARELVTGSNSNMSFWTNTGSALTQKMSILADGSVGIGTDSPFDSKLQVVGRIRAAGGTSGGYFFGSEEFDGGFYAPSDGNLAFSTNNQERMRITSAGNVGIGTDSPRADAYTVGLTIGNTTTGGAQLVLQENTLDGGWRIFNNGYLGFIADNDERMRITSAGNVLIGTQGTPNGTSVYGSGFIPSTVGRSVLKMASSTTNAANLIEFYNSQGIVGYIRTQGASTSFGTSSDYRLKEDLKDFAGLEMVSKIPVYDFKWKKYEGRSYGVMAHELQEVLPDAVSEEKDAEEMQGVDYSKIVPLLIKSIQELKAEIDILKAK